MTARSAGRPAARNFGAEGRARPGEAPDGSPGAPASTQPQPQAEQPPAVAVAVLDGSARQALVEQAAGKSTRQVQELLAAVDPELSAPADRVRPLGAERWEVKAVIDDDCRRGLEQLKGLLSHVDPHLTLGQLLGRVVQEAVERHDPARPPRRRRTGSRTESGVADETSAPKDKTGTGGAAPWASSDRPAESGASPPRSAPVPAAPFPLRSSGRSGNAIGAAAATWTGPAGAVAAPGICCRWITSSRTLLAAAPSRTISGSCAPPITAIAIATATPIALPHAANLGPEQLPGA